MILNSWKDVDLTWKLIAAITDNPEIKQGLFPGVGSNVSTAKGGGKKKTDHQFALAENVFKDHPDYGRLFAQAQTVKEKGLWGRRIKNRLKRCVLHFDKVQQEYLPVGNSLVEKTKRHIKDMGETGAGITSED